MKTIFEEYGEGIIAAGVLLVILPIIFGVFQLEIPSVLSRVYEIFLGGNV